MSLSYTTGGELDTVTDGNGTTSYERDTRGRLTKVTWPLRPGTVVAPSVSYQYDAVGNRTKLTTQNQIIDYTFDDLNRLHTVKPSTSSVPIATYSYDGVGNRASVTTDNGVTTSYSYNRRNRLTGIQHKLGATVLLGLAYTLDASGLRTGIAETGTTNRTVTYAYDGIKRLTSETVVQLGNDRRTSWTYDKTGNRLAQTKSLGPSGSPTGTASTAYVYDANDRLDTEMLSLSGTVPGATAGTTTYTYDAAGNTTKKVSPTETIDYVYDDANRLAELQTLAGDVTRYTYAHDGKRLSQTSDATGANPVTTHYLVDPNTAYAQVIEEAEQQGSGTPTLKALYAVGDDRIRRYTPAVAGSGGGPSTPAGLRYYHADGLGSTRLLTDETAAVTDQLTYEAFGELDAAVSVQTSDNAFMYTGEQFDPNAGFYYLRARYMNPANGRFTQQGGFAGFGSDPITLHKYMYASQIPTGYVDPSGNVTMMDVVSTLNSIANATSRVMRFVELFQKVDHAITMVTMIGKLKEMSTLVMSQIDPRKGSKADRKFLNLLRNYDEALAVFFKGSNFAKIGSDLVQSPVKERVEEFLVGQITGLLIYGPTPVSMPWLPTGKSRFKIGQIGLSKGHRDIFVELGAKSNQGGRVIGVGHTYGPKNPKGAKQWFRMDWHGRHGTEDWKDHPYHFHTKSA